MVLRSVKLAILFVKLSLTLHKLALKNVILLEKIEKVLCAFLHRSPFTSGSAILELSAHFFYSEPLRKQMDRFQIVELPPPLTLFINT